MATNTTSMLHPHSNNNVVDDVDKFWNQNDIPSSSTTLEFSNNSLCDMTPKRINKRYQKLVSAKGPLECIKCEKEVPVTKMSKHFILDHKEVSSTCIWCLVYTWKGRVGAPVNIHRIECLKARREFLNRKKFDEIETMINAQQQNVQETVNVIAVELEATKKIAQQQGESLKLKIAAIEEARRVAEEIIVEEDANNYYIEEDGYVADDDTVNLIDKEETPEVTPTKKIGNITKCMVRKKIIDDNIFMRIQKRRERLIRIARQTKKKARQEKMRNYRKNKQNVLDEEFSKAVCKLLRYHVSSSETSVVLKDKETYWDRVLRGDFENDSSNSSCFGDYIYSSNTSSDTSSYYLSPATSYSSLKSNEDGGLREKDFVILESDYYQLDCCNSSEKNDIDTNDNINVLLQSLPS